mmetsp:Transcript_25307/g.73236  ORF Transcript_25307/g.73236 Transcript_25307/m.73236 type:complete len:560 (+) Transcript_25307:135-1814(+)
MLHSLSEIFLTLRVLQLTGQSSHALGFSIRNHEEDQRTVSAQIRLVGTEVSTTLELDDVVLLEVLETGVANYLGVGQGVGVDEVLEVVSLVELVLGNKVVKLGKDDGGILGNVGEPRELGLGGLDVAFGIIRSFEAAIVVNLGDGDDTPAHEDDVLTDGQALGINLLDKAGLGLADQSLAHADVLGMPIGRHICVAISLGAVGHSQFHVVRCIDSHVPGRVLVNLLLVQGPELAPFHVDNSSRGALAEHEGTQSINVNATTNNTTDGGKARIIPPGNVAILDEPCQLALTELGVDKVHTSEGMDTSATKAQSLLDPSILFVAIIVLSRTECVSNSLNAINDGAGKIVGGIGLVLGTGTVMRRGVLAEHDRIAHGTIHRLHVDLSAEAPLGTVLAATAHELEVLQCLLGSLITMLRINPVHTLLLHNFLRRVVHECQAILDDVKGILADGLKVIGRKGHNVGLNTQLSKILEDAGLELLLLLAGVGIIEPSDEAALVPPGVVLVHQHGLGMTNVKVARGFGRKPRDDTAGRRPLEGGHSADEGFQLDGGTKDGLGGFSRR